MPFLTAPDGVEVQYELEGDGFPLVFAHGNMVLDSNSSCKRRS